MSFCFSCKSAGGTTSKHWMPWLFLITKRPHFQIIYFIQKVWFGFSRSVQYHRAAFRGKRKSLTCGRVKTLQAPVSGQDASHPTTTTHHPAAVWVWTRREPGAPTATAVFSTVCPAGLTGALLGPHAGGWEGEPGALLGCGRNRAELLTGQPYLAVLSEHWFQPSSPLLSMHPDIIGVL